MSGTKVVHDDLDPHILDAVHVADQAIIVIIKENRFKQFERQRSGGKRHLIKMLDQLLVPQAFR